MQGAGVRAEETPEQDRQLIAEVVRPEISQSSRASSFDSSPKDTDVSRATDTDRVVAPLSATAARRSPPSRGIVVAAPTEHARHTKAEATGPPRRR